MIRVPAIASRANRTKPHETGAPQGEKVNTTTFRADNDTVNSQLQPCLRSTHCPLCPNLLAAQQPWCVVGNRMQLRRDSPDDSFCLSASRNEHNRHSRQTDKEAEKTRTQARPHVLCHSRCRGGEGKALHHICVLLGKTEICGGQAFRPCDRCG